MSNFLDVSLFADIDSSGKIVERYNEDAVGEALRFYLTARQGDIIMSPDTCGILDSANFKTMNAEMAGLLKARIYDDLIKNFSPSIDITGIFITPDYERRLMHIQVHYFNPINRTNDSVLLSFASPTEIPRVFEYIDIGFTEENLMSFCMTQKSNFPDEKMILDADDNLFKWATFRFINFSKDDPFFSQVLAFLNT